MKINKHQVLTQKRGVTMLALAITVILLLIIGGVALSISLGQNGIFDRAKTSRQQYENTVVGEEEKLTEAYRKKTYEITGTIEEGQTSTNGNRIYNDGSNIAVIPKGFTVSGIEGENKIENGLVIYQTNGETVEDWEEAKTKYSQWVWVPVDDVEAMFSEDEDGISLTGSTGIKTNYYSKTATLGGRTLTRTTPGNTNGYREPDLVLGTGSQYDYANYTTAGFLSLKDMAENLSYDYQEMINSVKKYGGFYVGRYELSGSVASPTLKPGQAVLTNTNWYNLYKASKEFGKSNEAIETRMVWGSQWDAICRFISTKGDKVNIADSKTYGNYSNSTSPANVTGFGSKQNTGYSEKWKTNNIYDLAGNCWEWTQEIGNSSGDRADRGGSNYDNGYTSNVSDLHCDGNPDTSYTNKTTRPTLYIKDNKIQKEKPIIVEAEVKERTTHSIKVEVQGRLAEEYEFYIKKDGESDYTKVETIRANTSNYNDKETVEYEYDNLSQTSSYSLKIVLKNSNGEDEKEITGQTTTTVTAPTVTIADANKYTREKEITITESNDYRLKYTTDGSVPSKTNGRDYVGTFVVNENCTVTAGYFDDRWQIGEVATATVTKIDRVEPVITERLAVTDSTTNSSSVTITVADTDSGLGKIEWYKKLSTDEVYTLVETTIYAQENGEEAGETTSQTKTYTYENLTQTTSYNFKAIVYDVAGNKIESISNNAGDTETVTPLSINTGTTNWQNSGTKSITITAENSNFAVIKYTTNGSMPSRNVGTEISNGGTFNVSENCTIKAIAFDSTWQAGTTAVANVTRFDFEEPGINSPLTVTDTTTNSSSVTVTVSDLNAQYNSGIWKTEWYYKLKENTTWTKHGSDEIETGITGNGTATGPTAPQEKTHTFTNLTQTKEYDFKVIVTDVAGNSIESTTSDTTYTVTTLNIVVANANEWKTNKDVTITANNNNYTQIVYTTDGTTPAVSSNGTVTNGTVINSGASFNIIANNTTIKAIAFDGTNQAGVTATATVTKIDRNAPTYSSYEIKNVGYYGYDVYVYGVTDNNECGVNRVQFPTWTTNNGQDDIVPNYEVSTATKGTDLGNGTWYFRVNISDHNNESGEYITQIYLYDNLGNRAGAYEVNADVPAIPTLTYTVVNSDPNTWQTSKQVTINASNDNYSKIVYTTDGTTPAVSSNGTVTNGIEYTNPFNITTNNTTIKAYAFDNTYSPNTITTTTVTNVEIVKPVINTELNVTSTTTNSATVSIRATDALSGFAKVEWYYKEDGVQTDWVYVNATTDKELHSTTAGSTSAQTKTYTYEGLSQTKTYNFMARVYDVAGNYIDSATNGTTQTVTTLNITVANADVWRTNKNVTITANNSNYTKIVYTTDGSTPTATTGTLINSGASFNVTANCTVKAIAFDSTNQAGATATKVVTKIDTTAPVINTVTASDTLDIASFVDFNATDSGSGIVGYNISTSNTTAPTTWIPVVSTVETATETKYENDAAWARVFHHNNHWGTVLFSNANDWAEAKSANTIDKYSVLGNIANYKNASNWELMLQYPDVSSTQYNRWTQTDNPITTSIANTSSGTKVGGYTAVHVDWTGDYWGGLALSSAGETFLNGSTGHYYWLYAIGTKNAWSGGIPGPNGNAVSTANLWSRIDNLSTTSSTDLTRRLGDLKENTTYYVWVKDEVGYTTCREITVGNVDRTAPTAEITSTNNVATTQTATLNLGDNNGVTKYYFGKSNPENTTITWTNITSTTSTAPTATVDSEGTWYLGVQDAAGNRTVTSKTFYKTTLTPNRGSVTPAYVITPDGSTFTLPTPSEVAGYTWAGWYKEAGLSTSAGTTYAPAGDTTLYGKWTANTYTVTANANGGTIPSTSGWTNASGNGSATKTVTYDSTYGTLPTPTRTGYTFAGWNGKNLFNINNLVSNKYLKNDGSESNNDAWVLSEYIPITGNTNYTFSYENDPSHTYSQFRVGFFDENKNIISEVQGFTAYAVKYINTFLTPSNAKYVRVNYSINVSGNIVERNYIQLEEGSTATEYEPYFINDSTIVKTAENHTITAQWTPVTYTISYDLAGGSVSTANPTSYNIETNTFTLNNPTREGYTFTGWTGSNGNTPQTSVTIAKGTIGNKTYTANWQINQYTVTYEDWFVDSANGRKVHLGTSTDSINYGTSVSGADKGEDTALSKYYSYYQYKSSTSGTVPANNNLVVYRYFWGFTDLNIYYANGNQGGATVSFSNDGTNWVDRTNEVNSEVIKPWGTTYYIKNIRPINSTEEFDSVGNLTWDSANSRYYYTPTVAGTAMNVVMRYKTFTITLNNQSATSAGTTTIYEKYRTGYYLNSNNTNQMTTSANGIDVPTRTGYTFGGYYTETNGGGTQYIDANGKLTSSASVTNFSANGTLYAKWTANQYTLKLNPNGGTISGSTAEITASQKLIYDGSNYYNVNYYVPTRTGYTFNGWYTSATGGTKVYNADGTCINGCGYWTNNKYVGTTDLTVYAQWTINQYNVRWESGNLLYGLEDQSSTTA